MSDDARLRSLLAALDATADEELDCEGTLEHMAAYFESLESGQRSRAIEQVEQHLTVCPCCQQELRALMVALAPDA